MPLVEHLRELRRRLFVSVIAVAIGAVIAFIAFPQILHWMVAPYHHVTGKHSLIFTSPLEAFTTRLKVAGFGGIVLAAPVLLWETWQFVTPGLHENERRYAIPFMVSSLFLFAVGGAVEIGRASCRERV